MAAAAGLGFPNSGFADPPPPPTNLPGPVSVVSNLLQSFEFDSNPLLVPSGARPVFGSITQPQFILTGITPTLQLSWNTRLDINEFDLKNYSSVDVHSKLTGSDTWQTGYLKLTAGLDYDTTRTSELTTSGINIAGIRHTGISVSPELGLDLTPSETLVLTGTYQEAEYAASPIYSNYRFFSFNPQYVYSFTQRDAGFVLLNATYFETTSNALATEESVGLGLGWEHHFNARFSATASGGGQWSRDNATTGLLGGQTVSATSIGFFYNFALTYTGVLDTIQIESNRGISPQSVGETALATTFSATEAHNFTPRLLLNLAASYVDNAYSLSSAAFASSIVGREREYLELDAALRYNLTRSLSVQPAYRFRTKQAVGVEGVADSQSVMLNVVFTPHAAILGW